MANNGHKARENEKRRSTDKDECVSPHEGTLKWCLKMFLIQRDNEYTMGWHDLGFRATEHLALQAHGELKKGSPECTWERNTFSTLPKGTESADRPFGTWFCPLLLKRNRNTVFLNSSIIGTAAAQNNHSELLLIHVGVRNVDVLIDKLRTCSEIILPNTYPLFISYRTF